MKLATEAQRHRARNSRETARIRAQVREDWRSALGLATAKDAASGRYEQHLAQGVD